MGFLPEQPATKTDSSIIVPPIGDPEAKICLIGEAPAGEEVRLGEPFIGPSGRVLEQCLHSARLTRADVMITNSIKHRIPSPARYLSKRGLTELGRQKANELKEELLTYKANVFVPMGNLALAMLLDKDSITKYRGYVYESTLLPGKKVIPTIHPAAALRGKFIYRHFITHDLNRAREEAEYPQILYPEIRAEIPETYQEMIAWLEEIKKYKTLSIDIEIIYNQVSCVGFGINKEFAVTIPLYNSNLSLEEEVHIWTLISEIMYDCEIAKIGQNFIFDMMFLLQQNKILTRGKLYDTMIGHSLVYPDFPKRLDFLGSLYTRRPYWKDMVKWRGKDINKEDS